MVYSRRRSFRRRRRYPLRRKGYRSVRKRRSFRRKSFRRRRSFRRKAYQSCWRLIDKTEVTGLTLANEAVIQPIVEFNDITDYATMRDQWRFYKIQKIMIRYRLEGGEYDSNMGYARSTVSAGGLPGIALPAPAEDWYAYSNMEEDPRQTTGRDCLKEPTAHHFRFGSRENRCFSHCCRAVWLQEAKETGATVAEVPRTGWISTLETGVNHFGPVVVHSNYWGTIDMSNMAYSKELWVKVILKGSMRNDKILKM